MLSDPSTPPMWEYTIVHTDHLNGPSGPQLAPIWRRKYADGSTDWDQINKLGEDGWEMVNAFPVEGGGTLQYLAFVFKRPKRQRSAPPELAAEAEAATASEPASLGELAARSVDQPANPDAAAKEPDSASQ